jgi:hypothetical protein
MSPEDIIPGCIIEWDDFELASGEKEPKIFVIVGAKPDLNYLAIRATSKKSGEPTNPLTTLITTISPVANSNGSTSIPGFYFLILKNLTWRCFTSTLARTESVF